MNFDDLVSALTPERYAVLKRAIELGKWPDGRLLVKEERDTSLQVVIAYDRRNKPEEERIGYIPKEKKTECEHDDSHNHADHVSDDGCENIIFKG